MTLSAVLGWRIKYSRVYAWNYRFIYRNDAFGKEGILTRMRIIATLSVLTYSKRFDEMEELCVISHNSASQSMFALLREL